MPVLLAPPPQYLAGGDEETQVFLGQRKIASGGRGSPVEGLLGLAGSQEAGLAGSQGTGRPLTSYWAAMSGDPGEVGVRRFSILFYACLTSCGVSTNS